MKSEEGEVAERPERKGYSAWEMLSGREGLEGSWEEGGRGGGGSVVEEFEGLPGRIGSEREAEG